MKRIAIVLAAAVALGLPACGSDGSTSGTSGSSSGGLDDCAFTGTLSGGVTASITANGCGTSAAARVSMAEADLASGRSLGAAFDFVTPLKGGELGAIPLKSFEIFLREGKGSDQLVWSSTSCTLTLEKNVSSPTTVFKNRFLLAGRGSCASPVEPKAPNTRPAVVVSAFEMKAFIDPR